MSWTPARALQSISRVGRTVKPVVILDIETRSTLSLDAKGDTLCCAYKIGDGPVHIMPWPTVPLCRGEVDGNKADLDRSWLTRKMLTFAAWARSLSKR